MTFFQGPEIMPGMVPDPWSGTPWLKGGTKYIGVGWGWPKGDPV